MLQHGPLLVAIAHFINIKICVAGEDQGFLEKGFICIKVWGFPYADFISFFLNIP